MNISTLLKTDNIIKTPQDATLSSSLRHLNSSHDATFVFDENDTFLGVISPYYTLIKTNADPSTKVKHALFHPPKIHLNDPIPRVCKMMIESKVHYLPVFDDTQSFCGIITSRRIMKWMKNEQEFTHTNLQSIVVGSNKKNLVTIEQDQSLLDAIELYKNYKISKLVVVDANETLKGLLSHYDLIPYLTVSPSRTDRKQSTSDKHKLSRMKVKQYAKRRVITMRATQSVVQAIEKILDLGIGSIVVVDANQRPLGIITTRDILNLLSDNGSRKKTTTTEKNSTKRHQKELAELQTFIDRKIQKHTHISSAEIVFEEAKAKKVYSLTILLSPKKGKKQVIKKEDKSLEKVLTESKKALTSLLSKLTQDL